MTQPHFPTLTLYEDEDYLVINKPPGIATLAERTQTGLHFLQLAKAYHSQAQVGHCHSYQCCFTCLSVGV